MSGTAVVPDLRHARAPTVSGVRAPKLAGLVPVLLILLVGLALRLYHLDYQSLWGDEEFAVRLSREPLSSLLPLLANGEPHPPLYFVLLHAWRVVVGGGDFSLRLLSTLFSIAAISATYGLGLRLAGRRCAIGAALIAAANPFQVWYAQEVRMYAMLVALSALSVMLFVDAVRTGQRVRWGLYVMATGLALYTHYHALFIVLFENVAAVVWWLRTRSELGPTSSGQDHELVPHVETRTVPFHIGWIGSQIALLVIFAPWASVVQSMLRSWAGGQLVGWPWIAPPDLAWVLVQDFSRQTLGTSFTAEWVSPAAVFVMAMAALGFVSLLRERRDGAWLLAGYALVPLLAVWLLGQLVNRSLFHERFLIGASPALYLLLGQVAGWRGRRSFVTVLGILLLLGASAVSLRNHYFDGRFQKDDLHGLARYIDARARSGDLIVASITRSGLYQRYATNNTPVWVLPTEVSPSDFGQALSAATAGYKRIWFLPYAYDDGDLAVERWLSENAYPAGERWFNTARIEVAGLSQRTIRTAPVNFANRLKLYGFGVSAESFVPGDVIGVALDWVPSIAEVRDVKASLRLIDARGHTNGQIDRPVGADPHDNLGLMLAVDTPPGTYKLELRLYDVSPGGRDLSLIDERGNATGTVLGLGEVRVDRSEHPAPVAALETGNPTSISFGQAMRLAGFELPAGAWRAGDRVAVVLHWQGLLPDGKEYRPILRLIAANGQEAARYVSSIRPLAVAQWRSGELIREIYDWRLPPGLAAGEYTAALEVDAPDGAGIRLSTGERTFKLGTVSAEARAGYAPPSPPQRATSFSVGRFAALEGYDLSAANLHPGDTLQLTLHWKAVDESEQSYKVFTHLLSKDDSVVGQQDSVPCQGACPTSSWSSGEQIADKYSLKLQEDAPPGTYRVEIGMYSAVDGKRLQVTDSTGRLIGDRIIIGEVTSDAG